jgi:hypothetical protein
LRAHDRRSCAVICCLCMCACMCVLCVSSSLVPGKFGDMDITGACATARTVGGECGGLRHAQLPRFAMQATALWSSSHTDGKLRQSGRGPRAGTRMRQTSTARSECARVRSSSRARWSGFTILSIQNVYIPAASRVCARISWILSIVPRTGVTPKVESILSPGQGLRTRAKRTTGKQGLRHTPRPEAPHSILSPGQGLRTRAKRTTGKQGLRYTPRPGAPHYIVPRTGVADTCQTHYGQTGPTLHA